MVIIESFLFTIADRLLAKLGSLARQELSLVRDLQKDLKALELTLSTVKAVLLDADEKQADDQRLRVWLGQLKDVFYDAEDVLDEFEFEILQTQVDKARGIISRKVRQFFSHSNPVIFRFDISHKIKKIKERLSNIAALKTQFSLSESLEIRRVVHERREMTHSFVPSSDVVGRGSDKEKIIEILLRPDNCRNVSTLAIVGIGGLGKTTLAKLVFNDPRIHNERFDPKLWVCVSDDFDLKQLMVKMFKSSSNEDCSHLDTDQLQGRLRDKLDKNKFFLVLDDVWNDNLRRWNELENLLIGGATSSRILVTTRSATVASIMSPLSVYELGLLSHDYCLSLFKKNVFRETNEKCYPRLVEIGSDIVKKCGGIPLVVTTLASLLCSTTSLRDWLFIRDNEIWKFPQKEGDILPALKLSYDQMPSYLKQCFSFFSLFPKDYEFHIMMLIRM